MSTFYRKIVSKFGRVKYEPVMEYDNDLSYALPKGSHLITVEPGCKSTIYNVEPDTVRLLAAAMLVKEKMIKTLLTNADMRPKNSPITPEQQEAWENFRATMSDQLSVLHGPSINDVYQSFIDELIKNTDSCFENPAVKKAWDNFILMYQLSLNSNNT